MLKQALTKEVLLVPSEYPPSPFARSYQILGPLLRATAKGDKDAFAELYKLTSKKLLSICVSIVPEAADADEVLQEVYVVIWCKAASYDEARSSPITWLARLARNRSIDHLRVPKHLLPDACEPDSELRDPDALSLLIATQEQQRVTTCLGKLDAPTQRAIRGAFLLEVTHVELAKAEGVPLGTMKSRVRRGLLTLRERLEMQDKA